MAGGGNREGISLLQLAAMFPDEASAMVWFEKTRWPEDRHCGHCGSVDTKAVPNAKPTGRCIRTSSRMQGSITQSSISRSKSPSVWAIVAPATATKAVAIITALIGSLPRVRQPSGAGPLQHHVEL